MTEPVQGQVYDSQIAEGQFGYAKLGRLGDGIVSEYRGRYAELTRRGRVYSANLTATTTGVAAGNVTGAAAAASTNFALWNPTGSGVNLELLYAYVGVISGTPVGGPLFHNTGTAPTIAGTAGSPNLTGGPSSSGRFSASAAGATLTAGGALTALRPMAVLNFSAGAYVNVAGSTPVMEPIEGRIILTPGNMWVPCWQAAGTTLLNAYGVEWAEVPV